ASLLHGPPQRGGIRGIQTGNVGLVEKQAGPFPVRETQDAASRIGGESRILHPAVERQEGVAKHMKIVPSRPMGLGRIETEGTKIDPLDPEGQGAGLELAVLVPPLLE